jgi:hypothetical protein
MAAMAVVAGMTAQPAGAATTLNGAELYSVETVKFGRWEIRMKVAATPGSVSSFFTYYNNSYLGSPEPWREIDIEILGKNGKGFQSNLLTGNAAVKTSSEIFHATNDDLTAGFHTYVLDWTPDSIVYRIDGVTVRTTPGSNAQVKDLSDQPHSYRMNLWASTAADWVGALDPEKLPVIQTVNWMTYSAYTPGQGPNGSNFTPKWTDDFASLNTGRWALGNWTFDQNMADFTADNARVSNGYLMLFLSKKGWSGTLVPPNDPLGSSRPTSIQSNAPGARFFAEAVGDRLSVNVGDRMTEAVVSTLSGRVLARSAGSGILEFKDLPHGCILLVRTALGSRLVPMP